MAASLVNTRERYPPSTYFNGLDEASKARYEEKISFIGGVDPYSLPKRSWSEDPDIFPAISYADIVNFVLFSPSPYTLEDMRSYKSLEAYNQFVNGWVRDVSAYSTPNTEKQLIIVYGRVMHSQRLRETPLKPWIVAEKDGKVVAAHCDCMAGLGETCTHVCAVLFYLETKVRIRDSKTVTQEAAYWKMPSARREVQYMPVHKIDFTSAQSQKRKLDDFVHDSRVRGPSHCHTVQPAAPQPTVDEINDLFTALNTCGKKSVVLSVLPGHCQAFKPADTQVPSLMELYKPEFAELTFNDLLEKSTDVDVSLTQSQADYVEQRTRKQAASKCWFQHRAGRITASKMKSACRTNPDQPSLSLIKSICYPGKNFQTQATTYGCEHEEKARQAYIAEMQYTHENFSLHESGLVINPKYPHLGASPDGVVSCDCCGTGVVEVKCPFCAKEKTVEEYIAMEKS
nr:uncharacterized protein LOC129261235 [Lytechinus pictus]